MNSQSIREVYSAGNESALSQALLKFQRQLITQVYAVGPVAVAFKLQKMRPRITPILNKIASQARSEPAKSVSYLAGFVSAYAGYLKLMVDSHDVDLATVHLSDIKDNHNNAGLVRMIILKATFTHVRTRTKVLIDLVASTANVSKSLVKICLRKLLEIKLVERITIGRRTVSYRITRLGEAVLARLSQPYELALYQIDEAACDAKLRAKLRDEIERTWPLNE